MSDKKISLNAESGCQKCNTQTSQQQITDDLEQLSKKARKIKDKKKKKPLGYGQSPSGPHSGHLDTQLFPARPMKAEASNKARASFIRKPVERDSYWKVSYKGDEVKLRIGDLFNNGLYDISEVKSHEFGTALALRLCRGNLQKEAAKLIAENQMQFTKISSRDFVNINKIIDIVSCAIPLNDYQRQIRDDMEMTIVDAIKQGDMGD